MSHKSWQNMEKCKEGKAIANRVFPISSVLILYLGRAVTALHSCDTSVIKYYGSVKSDPRYKIRTLDIGNTWPATTLHFSIFCRITEFSYGPGLMGHSVFFRWIPQNFGVVPSIRYQCLANNWRTRTFLFSFTWQFESPLLLPQEQQHRQWRVSWSNQSINHYMDHCVSHTVFSYSASSGPVFPS
jgi:hypothetical protein